ncbi:MAG: clostripain-related cysteine peptidase [Bacillota bacterium]
MKKLNTRKKIALISIAIFGLFLLSGCGSSGGSKTVDEMENEQLGYIDGYVYKTVEGYTLEESEGTEGAEGINVEIDGTIYTTNTEGYFKSNALISGYQYSVNIVVDEDNNNEPDFIWSDNVIVKTNSTININRQTIEKEWNIIMFISDKSQSLDEQVSYFLDTVSYNNDIKNLNFFIIHGKYLEGEETNKAYYLTGDGKKEIKDYGIVNFSDPSFYREEIQNIYNEFPAKRTMVTIQSHGDGWLYSGNPGSPKNWLAADFAHDEGGTDHTLDSFEIYDIFHDIEFDIDIFNMAACHMGQIEVISDFPSNINYVMASPSFGYTADMYVHKDVMRDISGGIFDPKTLAERYVDHYVDSLDSNSDGPYPSVKAVYNLEEMDVFINYFADISNDLNSLFLSNSTIKKEFQDYVIKSHENIQTYFHGSLDFEQVKEKDLIGIVEYLKNNPTIYGEEISNNAAEAYRILNNIVVYQDHSQGSETLDYNGINSNQDKFTYKNNNGISINVESDDNYQETWFNQKTNWYEILKQIGVDYPGE